jgi:ABC-type phosphate/phosphonate transport system permease subunit
VFAAPKPGEVAADALGATRIEATNREVIPNVFNNFIISISLSRLE